MSVSADVRRLAMGLAGLGVFTWLFRQWPQVSNTTTVALSFLIVVLFVAASARLWVAVATSMVSVFAFNFFFIPPVGGLTIADPQNWVALVAFLAVSLVASNLSAVARDRTREATIRRDEVGKLFDLSRDVLLIADSDQAHSSLAGFIARRFDLEYAAICLPRSPEWIVFESGALTGMLTSRDVADVPSGDGYAVITKAGHDVRVVPLRLGNKAVGLLATAGRAIDPGTLDAIAGLAAIAIERVQLLEERKTAELARQSEELKSALLASLGHDLRTPLTAIRVAADNLRSSWPDEQQRREQSELIGAEVDRLTRLFQNLLEMARIDAGAVTHDVRWVAPSEIVDAARNRVEHAVRGRKIEVSVESDRLVRVDPRLAAAAVAHLIENAAQYSPSTSSIEVGGAVSDDALTLTVRDHGPGIAPVDLPRVFDRFYRGADARLERSGTGMGLAIARGLLAIEDGRVAVENCPDGGARFTITIPTDVK